MDELKALRYNLLGTALYADQRLAVQFIVFPDRLVATLEPVLRYATDWYDDQYFEVWPRILPLKTITPARRSMHEADVRIFLADISDESSARTLFPLVNSWQPPMGPALMSARLSSLLVSVHDNDAAIREAAWHRFSIAAATNEALSQCHPVVVSTVEAEGSYGCSRDIQLLMAPVVEVIGKRH